MSENSDLSEDRNRGRIEPVFREVKVSELYVQFYYVTIITAQSVFKNEKNNNILMMLVRRFGWIEFQSRISKHPDLESSTEFQLNWLTRT